MGRCLHKPYNIVSAILRGMGDSKRPFLFIAIAALLNIALDILFVKYCGMEVFGAALATVIGQGVSFLISIVYLYTHKESFGFDFKLASFKIDGAATRSGAFSLINGSGRARLNLAVAMIDGVIGRIGLAALLGFAMKLDCYGFWMGDALAGFMPLVIGSVFYLSRKWRQ